MAPVDADEFERDLLSPPSGVIQYDERKAARSPLAGLRTIASHDWQPMGLDLIDEDYLRYREIVAMRPARGVAVDSGILRKLRRNAG